MTGRAHVRKAAKEESDELDEAHCEHIRRLERDETPRHRRERQQVEWSLVGDGAKRDKQERCHFLQTFCSLRALLGANLERGVEDANCLSRAAAPRAEECVLHAKGGVVQHLDRGGCHCSGHLCDRH